MGGLFLGMVVAVVVAGALLLAGVGALPALLAVVGLGLTVYLVAHTRRARR